MFSTQYSQHVGLGAALQARLSPYILSAADQQNEVQPKSIRTLKIPEYFAEYREKGDGLASFLGSSIVSKARTPLNRPVSVTDPLCPQIIFVNDPNGRNFVSKHDYAEKGPKAILAMSSSLL